MNFIRLTTKQGEAIIINIEHVISVRKLGVGPSAGCEVHVITGLVFVVDERWETFESLVRQ